jgi:hypothetical protein
MKPVGQIPFGPFNFCISVRPFLEDAPIEGTHHQCNGVETLRDKFYVRRETLRPLLVFCTGPFWYTQPLYFQHTFPSHISYGADTIATRYDTGRTRIPFWSLRCLYLGESFSRPGLPNRRYPSLVPILWHICRATKLSYNYYLVYHY